MDEDERLRLAAFVDDLVPMFGQVTEKKKSSPHHSAPYTKGASKARDSKSQEMTGFQNFIKGKLSDYLNDSISFKEEVWRETTKVDKAQTDKSKTTAYLLDCTYEDALNKQDAQLLFSENMLKITETAISMEVSSKKTTMKLKKAPVESDSDSDDDTRFLEVAVDADFVLGNSIHTEKTKQEAQSKLDQKKKKKEKKKEKKRHSTSIGSNGEDGSDMDSEHAKKKSKRTKDASSEKLKKSKKKKKKSKQED